MKFISVLAIACCLVLAASCGSTKKYASPSEWVKESMQSPNNLPLATKAEEWSEIKTFNLPNGGGTVEVSSQFIKQQATTCHYNVWFKNVGTNFVKATAGITTQERKNIYSHNSGYLGLEPGKEVTYKDLEARECPLRWGTNTEMDHCAACNAWIVFAQ